MFRSLWVGVVLCCAVSAPLRAQASPEAAAQAFGDAIKSGDWAAAARGMHPRALKHLRDVFTTLLEGEGTEEVGQMLFGLKSNAELAATPDTVLFASLLRTMLSQQEGLMEALRGSTFTPLGHVPAGADTVLVVSRMTLTIGGVEISQFEVMPFIQQDGRWWGLLKADFTNLVAMLQRNLGARRS